MDIRILIVASDLLVRMGLSVMMEQQAGCIVAGQLADLENVLASIELYHPDGCLLDLGMTRDDFPGALNLDVPIPLVMLCPPNSFSKVFQGQPAGDDFASTQLPSWLFQTGRAYLKREARAAEIMQAFHTILNGLVVFDPVIETERLQQEDIQPGEKAWSSASGSPMPVRTPVELDRESLQGSTNEGIYENLTKRELEVLVLIAEGLPNKRIAQSLGISEHTVKFHVNSIIGKLGVQSRTEAVTHAARIGILKL